MSFKREFTVLFWNLSCFRTGWRFLHFTSLFLQNTILFILQTLGFLQQVITTLSARSVIIVFFVCPSVSVLLAWRPINMKDSLKIVFQDIHFIRVYNNAPRVFVSANHTSTGGNQDPMHNSITAWVEVTQQHQIGECYRNKFTKEISQGKTIQELTCNKACIPCCYCIGNS